MTPCIVVAPALSIPLAGAVRDAPGRDEPAFAATFALPLRRPVHRRARPQARPALEPTAARLP